MNIILITLALILAIIGIIGCIIPGLPGHPLNFISLLMIQWVFNPFASSTLIILGVLTLIVLVLDYFIPIWTARRFGATKQGIIGSIVGMLLGMFFTPIGMILGTIAGAIIGDIIAGKSNTDATKSGIATFFGTLISIGLKLSLSIVMSSMLVYEIFKFYFN